MIIQWLKKDKNWLACLNLLLYLTLFITSIAMLTLKVAGCV